MKDELITISKGVPLLDAQTAVKIADFERRIKELKDAEEALKTAVLEEMEEKKILSIKTAEMTISYIASYDREGLDAKRLKEENPDLYDSYVKITSVKPSIKITLK